MFTWCIPDKFIDSDKQRFKILSHLGTLEEFCRYSVDTRAFWHLRHSSTRGTLVLKSFKEVGHLRHLDTQVVRRLKQFI